MNTCYLFQNASIYTQNPEMPYLTNAVLLVNQGIIKYVGTSTPSKLPPKCQYIDASNLLLCPGLVNGHTHSPMTQLRGYCDDCSLDEWLSQIWKAEASLSSDDFYWGALLGIAEMLSYGTTSISDMYRCSETILQAAIESGINANICESITCADGIRPQDSRQIQNSVALIREYQNHDNGRIRIDTSIQSIFQTTPSLWEYINNLAETYHLGIHTHICETAQEVTQCIQRYHKPPIELLDSYGIFHHRTAAVHGIFVSENEIEILKNTPSVVVHDPCSNLKCGCGFGNLKAFYENNIPVALGTDGVCSNNTGDLFDTMKFTALIQKMLNQDPSCFPAKDIIKMATINGLLSQGRTNSGILKEGFDADIIAIDLTHPGVRPLHHAAANLVYSVHGNHVVITMVRGKILYDHGTFTTIDIEKVYHHIKKGGILT